MVGDHTPQTRNAEKGAPSVVIAMMVVIVPGIGMVVMVMMVMIVLSELEIGGRLRFRLLCPRGIIRL
jgi:hypothetical protein